MLVCSKRSLYRKVHIPSVYGHRKPVTTCKWPIFITANGHISISVKDFKVQLSVLHKNVDLSKQTNKQPPPTHNLMTGFVSGEVFLHKYLFSL